MYYNVQYNEFNRLIMRNNLIGLKEVNISSDKILTLTAFLEGLYLGSGVMRAAQDEFGDHWGPTIADLITIELHDQSTYSTIHYSVNGYLSTTGSVTVSIPSSYYSSYYITIRNRNSIQTVSGGPVDFSSSSISFDFNILNNVYGYNMKDFGDGNFGIYAGDVNQDDIVDSNDVTLVDNASTAVLFGYNPEDINGDGLVDNTDITIVDNNSTSVVMAITP